jgi:L-asparaginase II
MVSGSGGFCTRVIEETQGRALVKTGAEGFYCGALPELGLGLALKVDDGAGRASEAIVARLLARLGAIEADHELLSRPLRNHAGTHVGELRAPAGSPV